MKRIVFLLGLLCGAALLGLVHGGWIARAAVSFLMVGGTSVALLWPRGWYINRIDTTNGNDTGISAFFLYVIVCVLATAVATVAAAFVPHPGAFNIGALVTVAAAAFQTARMHG